MYWSILLRSRSDVWMVIKKAGLAKENSLSGQDFLILASKVSFLHTVCSIYHNRAQITWSIWPYVSNSLAPSYRCIIRTLQSYSICQLAWSVKLACDSQAVDNDYLCCFLPPRFSCACTFNYQHFSYKYWMWYITIIDCSIFTAKTLSNVICSSLL